MRTHAEIIADAGGYKALADRLNKPRELTRFWHRRASIPSAAWPEMSRLRLASLSELAQPQPSQTTGVKAEGRNELNPNPTGDQTP